jgi:hypothetical protein
MKVIHFFNFAKGCAPFSSPPVPVATLDVIIGLVRKSKRLASKGIDACYDENADLKPACTGTIFAGDRPVARFRVIDQHP